MVSIKGIPFFWYAFGIDLHPIPFSDSEGLEACLPRTGRQSRSNTQRLLYLETENPGLPGALGFPTALRPLATTE